MRYDEIKWEDEDTEVEEKKSSDEVSFEELLATEGVEDSLVFCWYASNGHYHARSNVLWSLMLSTRAS